jgi:putative peptidoglycan lipid II flippase
LQDTKSPVTIGVITIIINIVLNFALIKPLGHGGLALAYSIAGLVNMVLLLYFLRNKIGHIDGREILKSFSKTLIASLIMGAIVYLTVYLFEIYFGVQGKFLQITEVILGVSVGALVYIVIVSFMKMEEANMAMGILLRRFRKRKSG